MSYWRQKQSQPVFYVTNYDTSQAISSLRYKVLLVVVIATAIVMIICRSPDMHRTPAGWYYSPMGVLIILVMGRG